MAILLKEQLKQLLEGVHYHAPFINVIKKGKEDPETLKNSRQIFYDFYAMEMMHSLFSEPEDSDKYKPEYIDGLKLTPKQKLKAQAVYNMGGGLALLGTHIDNIMLLPKGIQVVPQAFRNIVDNVYQEVVIQTAKKILAHLRLTLISEFRHLIDKADSWARFRRKLISIYNKKGIITQDDFENAIQTYIPGMAKHTDSIKRLLFFCKYYDEMYPDPADLISKSPEVGGIPGLKSKKRREPGEEPEFSPELDKPIDADGEKETEPSPELDKPIDTDGESDDVDIDEPMTKVPSGAEMDTSPYKYQKEIDLLKLKQYFDKLKKDKNKKKLQEAKYDASYAAGKIHPGTVLIIKKAIQKSGLKWEDILLAYKHIDWNASFGGPRWGEGVDAYLRLDANTRKHNFKEMVSDIDHIYDLEHNTGAFLNKGGMYVKTKDLDRRAKITRLSQFIPDVSPIIKQIIIRALKYSTKYPEIEQDIYGPHKMEYIPFTSEEEEVLKSFGFTRTVDNNIWNVGTSYRDKNGKRVLNPIAIKHLANGKYVIYDLINTELEIFETWDEFKTWFKENSKRFERGGYASGLVAKTQKGSNPSSTSKSPVTTKPPGIVTHQVLYPLSSEESEQLEKLDNKKDNIGFKIDSKGISKFGTFLFGNFYTTLIVCKIHPTHNTEKYYVVHYSDVGINTWEFSTWSQTLMFVKSNFSKLTKYKELDIDALNIPSPTLDLKAESLPPHSPSKATYKAHIGIDKPPIHTIRLTAEDEQYLFIYGFHPKMEGENIYYLHEVLKDKIKFYPNNTALISFSSMHPFNNTVKKSIEDTLAWIKLGYQPINQSKVKPEEKPEIKPEINPEEKPKIKYTNGFKLSSMYENMLSQKGFNWSPSSTMYINSSNGDAIYVQQNLKSIYSDGETGETSLFNSLPELAVFLKKYDELKKKVVSKQEFISEQEFIAELKKYGFDLMPSNKEESSKDKIFTFHNQIKGDTVVYSKINGKLFYVDASSSDKKEFKDFNQILDYIKNNVIHVTEIYSNNLNDSEIRYIDNIAEKNNLIFKNSIIPGTAFNQIILKNTKGVHLYTITKKDNTYYLYHINSTDGNPNVKILKEEKKWVDFIAHIIGEFSAYKSNSYTIPGITPSEFKTIKKELLKEDEHIWLEYYSGDSGGPAYAIAYYRQDKYKPSDIIFGIHSDVEGYYIYGPINKKEEYAMTFEELMVKVKNRASKIKFYQPVTGDNKKLILNTAKKNGFKIKHYSDIDSFAPRWRYIFQKNNTYINISKAGITYEVVGIFNSITQFDTPRFINWFKNIYPSKIFPQTTSQLINNIINLLKNEINPKTMSLISKKHIVFAVKKLTEYIHKITGAPCGLQNCKIAIENFKLFLEYIEKNGLPNMDKDASNLTIIKNKLALTKPKINMDFTTAKSYKVYNIKWDCSSKETISRLPKDIEIEVPNDFQEEPEISDWLSDRISDITGWCHFGFEYEPLIDKEKFDNSPKVPQKSIDIPSYIEINPKANYSEEFGSLYYPDKNILTLILNSNFKEVKITGGFQWVHPNGFSFKIYENAIEWDSIIEKKACLANKRFHRIYFLKALKEVDKNTDINKLDFLFEDASTRTSDYIMDKMMVEAAKDGGEDIKRTTIGNLIEKKGFKWNSDENYWYNINLKQIVVSKSNDKDEILFKVYWFKNGNYYISRFNEVQLLKSIGFDGDIIKGIINTEEEKEEDTPENNFLKIKQQTMDAELSKTDKKHNINVSMEDISDIKANFKNEFSYYDYGGWAKNTSHSPDSTIRLINKDESLMKKIGFSLNKDENNVYYYFNKEDIKVFFFVDGHAEIIWNNGELTNFPAIEKAIFNLWEQFYIKKMKEDAELLPIIDNFNVKLSESKEQILKSLGFNLVEKDGSIYYVKSNWEITFYRNGYTCIRDLKTGKIINSFYTHDEAIDYLKNNLK